MEGSSGLMPIEDIFKLLGTYGFPTVLSIYLIIRLDFYLKETIKSNKILATTISTEIRDLKNILLNRATNDPLK